ncbi:glycine-rich protein [Luminiphilus syltensis]|nr:glycine-rich protein [Luminiphilus syltensis]
MSKARYFLTGLALCAGSAFGVTDTYTYTGAAETFVVPTGVTSVTIEAWGAQGGMSDPVTDNLGGYAKGDLSVSPGDVLNIYVGGQPSGEQGGFNGGGAGDSLGAGGGGASDVRTAGNTLSDRVIVAGGGGGGGEWNGQNVIGGVGGGLTGGDGSRLSFNPGGGGGTQTASANGTCRSLNNPIVAGGFGFGGTTAGVGCGCEGYGGGGGWYGGGGSGNCRGGGGGSSYIQGLANGSTTAGVRAGNGEIQITYTASASSPVIGLAKQAGAVSSVGSGVYQTDITLIVENLGDVALSNVQVADVLSTTFPAPATFTVSSGPIATGTLTTNAGFDGDGDTNLLMAGSSSLAIGAFAQVSFTVQFSPNGLSGPFSNQAEASAEGPSNTTNDTSDDGVDPDPNGNGNPDEAGENDPTPIVIPSPPDPDSDGDGVFDSVDEFPEDPVESVDSDGDGIGDNGDAGGSGVGIVLSGVDRTCAFNGPVTGSAVSTVGAPGVPFPTQLAFQIDGCGSPVQISAKFGNPLPAGSVAYKRSAAGVWTAIPGAVVSGDTITYSIEDGGPLDSDGIVNDSITDPVTAVVPFSTPIPALPVWAYMILAMSMLLLAFRFRRQRNVFR